MSEPGTPDGAAPLLAWSPAARHDPPHTTAARERARAEAAAEHRRLLYVALTRAEERLIIAGHTGKQKRPADSWYDMIEGTLRAAGARLEAMPDGLGERLIWERAAATVPQRTQAATVVPAAEESEPDWLRRAPLPEPERPVPLRPSETAGANGDTPASGREALPDPVATTGSLLHRLLQTLPDLPAAERTLAAWRLLSAVDGPVELAIDPDTLVAEAMGVLDASTLAPLFAPGSQAEVPLAGRLVRPGRPDYLVSGRADRIAVTPDAVWLADFKTTREVPADVAAVPAATLRQLAVYRALLTRLYPDRPVRALLIHTLGPSVLELPGEALDSEIERLTGA